MTAIAIFIGVLKNNWGKALVAVTIVALLATIKVERELLTRAHTQNARQAAELEGEKEAASSQAAAAAADAVRAKQESDVIQAQLQSAYAAHSLTAAALSAAVVRYEDTLRACPLSGASALASGRAGARAGAGSAGSPAATIGALVEACQHDADELKACQAFAKTCAAPPQ